VEEELRDLSLLSECPFRTARPGRIRGNMKRSRALPAVSRVYARTALQQTANRLRTPGANRAMQWSGARLVLVLDVGPGIEDPLDDRALFRGVPRLSRSGSSIARIVQCGRPAAILGVGVRPSFEQRLDRQGAEGGGGQVKSGVSYVQLVRNFLDETLARGSRARDLWRRSDESYRAGFVGDDSREELDECLGFIRQGLPAYGV
jgi:hypothetical protein